MNLDTNRKTVQHLEAGVVKTIHVREDLAVSQGQLLVTLDDTTARAEAERLHVALNAQLALRASSRRTRRKTLHFFAPRTSAFRRPSVGWSGRPRSGGCLSGAQSCSRGQIEFLKAQIAQHRKEITGYQGEVEVAKFQIDYLKEENSDISTLLDQGLVEEHRLLALKRRWAEVSGELVPVSANIARCQQAIAES